MQKENKALQGAYNIAKSKGYNKSLDEFSSLISTNNEALNNIYIEAKSKGYSKSLDEFSDLMGVKKKDNSNSTVPQKSSESNSGNISLDTSRKLINKSNPEVSKLNDDLQATYAVSDTRKQEITQKVDAEINQEGIWNNIKHYGKKALNAGMDYLGQATGMAYLFGDGEVSKDLKFQTNPLENELKEVNKQIKQDVAIAKKENKPIPTFTEKEKIAKARDLKIQKEIKSESDSQVRSFIKEAEKRVDASGISDKEKLKLFQTSELDSLSEKDRNILKKKDFLEFLVDNNIKEINEVKNNKYLTPVDRYTKLSELYNKHKSNVLNLKESYEDYVSNQEKIGNIRDNIDVLKRNYGWLKNFVDNAGATGLDLTAGGLSFLDWLDTSPSNNRAYTNDSPLRKASSFLRDTAEDVRSKIAKPISIEDINFDSPNFLPDFGQWFLNTAVANQVPIYATIATGAGGIAALGASATGTKYEDMLQDQEKEGVVYSDMQKTLVPIGYGASETISATVDRMVMMNAKRVFQSATLPERKMISGGMWQGVKEFSKEFGKGTLDVAKNTVYEGIDEAGTEIMQNLMDIHALGKKDVGVFDNVFDATAAGMSIGFIMSGSSNAFSINKALKNYTVDNNISKANKEILRLEKALDNPNLSVLEQTTIESQLNKAKVKSQSFLEKVTNNISSLSNEEFDALKRIERTQANLKEQAKEIQKGELEQSLKDQIVSNLKDEFDAVENQRVGILKQDANTILGLLPQSEILRLKNEASKELLQEQDPEGNKTINLEDAEISKRALENYRKEETEKKALKTNEAAQKEDIVSDGNIQPGNDKLDSVQTELENQPQGNNEVQSVQPTETVEGLVNNESKETLPKPTFDKLVNVYQNFFGAGNVHNDTQKLEKVLGENPNNVFFQKQWEGINNTFNNELEQLEKGVLPKGHIFKLGSPTKILQAAGIPNLPIELAASRISDKQQQVNHPFELSEIKDLAIAVQNPLAVFDSSTVDGSFVVLTEIKKGNKNFIAAIEVNKVLGKIEVNSIRSVYPRKGTQIASAINNNLTRYADKQKMREWFSKQRFNSADVKGLFSRASNIIQKFENPIINDVDFQVDYKRLASDNKYTQPKVPTQNIFMNDVEVLSRETESIVSKMVDEGKNVSVKSVDVSNIIPTQKNVNINNLKEVQDIRERPLLFKQGDKYYVIDGHHRISNEILEGEKKVEADVYDIDTQFMQTPDGTIWGATYLNEQGQREIYINESALSPETLLHEVYHPFDNMMKQASLEGDNHAISAISRLDTLANENGYLKKVQDNPNYANKSLEQQQSEARVQMIGEIGNKQLDSSFYEKLEAAVVDAIRWLSDKLGISLKDYTSDQILNLKLEEIVKGSLASANKGDFEKKKGIDQRQNADYSPSANVQNRFDASPSEAKIQNDADSKKEVDEVKQKSKRKKQAFTNRAFNSENLNNTVREKLDELGLKYDVESQELAQKNAEKIIKELGIADAYILAKEGKIRGGARMWVMAQTFEDINKQISDAVDKNDTKLVEYLSDELALIMKVFANERTLNGQETAMLNRIYNNFEMKYDLGLAKERWEKQFGDEMPVEIEAILKKQSQNIEKLEKQIKELEDKVGTLEEQEAFSNIQEALNKESNKKPSESSLKKAASALRKTKFTKTLNDLNKLQSDPLGVLKGILDGAIEVAATALEAGATIEQAVKKGIEEIKKSNWYKKLSNEGKIQAESISKKDIRNFIKKELSIPSQNNDIEQGAIKVEGDLLYRLVADGIDNIKDLTDAVHKTLESKYPNLTHREVRDAITGYGKQINETQDVIKKEISKLKTDGKQISALEDLSNNKRPLRSGRKPKEYTSEQRNRIKQIKELLKNLSLDDSTDKQKYYKDALEVYKTRVKNRLNDLQDAIDKNERIIKEKRNTILDDEAKQLIKQKEELQKEYDDHFGKVIKSEETLVNETVNRKEKSLRNLELELEFVKNNQKQSPKAEKKEITATKIDILNKQIAEKRTELNNLLEEVGIAETKRLERAKKYQRNRLSELKEKLANKDFTKRKTIKVKYDTDLADLKLKVMETKTKWDIEFEKEELRKRGIPTKVIDIVFKTFGTIKGLKATADLSALLRQGIMLGLINPKEFGKSAVNMHKFAFSNDYYKKWMSKLESSKDYINIIEDGVFIADNTVQRLRQEEAFMDSMLSKIPIVGNITGGSERAYSGFLNMLRVEVYRKYAAEHEAFGYTRENDPEVFKAIGSLINSATLRGPSITTDPTINRALNVVFFSPKAITAPLGLLKTAFNSKASPIIRKRAVASFVALAGYNIVMTQILAMAWNLLVKRDDEDEEATVDYNPVSTDFAKLKIGKKRYDTTAGIGIQMRTLARFLSNRKSQGIDYDTMTFEELNSDRFNDLGRFFLNKFSPAVSTTVKTLNGKHPEDFYKDLEDATTWDFTKALFIPIGIADIIEAINNNEEPEQIMYDLILNTYGIGVQEY
ncbi:MAG: hypothetical protein LBE34_12700 [Flavobacteriaceae bacterium]|jgi:hypothetical protein|nr:hypothetical protein [Flavobacteriaceae bacterium]